MFEMEGIKGCEWVGQSQERTPYKEKVAKKRKLNW
jgi:hypothetical protein